MDQGGVTWIVTAEAAEARVFCERARTGPLRELPELRMAASDAEIAAASTRHERPRQHEGELAVPAAGRHSVGARRRDTGEFERLVLMGPPRALGLLKMALPPGGDEAESMSPTRTSAGRTIPRRCAATCARPARGPGHESRAHLPRRRRLRHRLLRPAADRRGPASSSTAACSRAPRPLKALNYEPFPVRSGRDRRGAADPRPHRPLRPAAEADEGRLRGADLRHGRRPATSARVMLPDAGDIQESEVEHLNRRNSSAAAPRSSRSTPRATPTATPGALPDR